MKEQKRDRESVCEIKEAREREREREREKLNGERERLNGERNKEGERE